MAGTVGVQCPASGGEAVAFSPLLPVSCLSPSKLKLPVCTSSREAATAPSFHDFAPTVSPQLHFLKYTHRELWVPQQAKHHHRRYHHHHHHDCPLRLPLKVRVSVSQAQGAKEDSGFIRKKLAVFVSGGGSNFRTLHKSALDNKIYGDITVVVSDKPACKGCDYARSSNIPVLEYPRSSSSQAGLSPMALVAALRNHKVDFVVLAGYLKLLPMELIQAYPRSILNIHPALLPAFGGKGFYGMKVHEAVIKSGARFSGPTVHFVDEKYDHGVILAQRVVPVLPYDTPVDLAARVLIEEHILYPEAVAALCEDRIFWREDGVPLIRKSWGQAEYY